MSTARQMRMPFGRFRGLPLDEIPTWYLSWLEGLPDLREPLRRAVAAECERRFLRDESGPGDEANSAPDHLDLAIAHKIVDRGVRSLARELHPDVGGNHEPMVAVNIAAEWLRSMLRELSA